MARRDALTNILRTKAWAVFCRESLGANSWYAVENILEAGAFGRDTKGHICHRGKWTGYAQGKHLPRNSLIKRVEELIPGSFGILNHPIWELRKPLPEETAKNVSSQLSRLRPEVRARFFHNTIPPHQRRKRITQQTLEFLETQVTLCGLGALALIVLEAYCSENKRLAFQAGCALFKLLLRLPIDGPAWLASIDTDLFELLKQRVFPFAVNQNHAICLDDVNFPRLVQLVRRACTYTTEEKKHFSRDAFFSRLFDQPWCTQVGFLTIAVPANQLKASIRADDLVQDDPNPLIKHWEDAYSKVLELETR